ncbi:MAG TPA: hypothetical protein VGN95_25140 [Pyrinomonadaceae bacterium]|jgi:hypothetical protein|nr:hypothetical protein [Pyrinomonadaceae bacterium]
MSILSDFLDSSKESRQKKPTLRRVPPTFEQFRDNHPISALASLERNALAFESYRREQARASRPRTVRPVRTGFAVSTRRAA